ncbi:hypothetical protein, partial [Escherichia coli]|uniref:hypothetical protein n=1 Tax=Escherichia coli TaxID=562 RepID=UPI003B9E1377
LPRSAELAITPSVMQTTAQHVTAATAATHTVTRREEDSTEILSDACVAQWDETVPHGEYAVIG